MNFIVRERVRIYKLERKKKKEKKVSEGSRVRDGRSRLWEGKKKPR